MQKRKFQSAHSINLLFLNACALFRRFVWKAESWWNRRAFCELANWCRTKFSHFSSLTLARERVNRKKNCEVMRDENCFSLKIFKVKTNLCWSFDPFQRLESCTKEKRWQETKAMNNKTCLIIRSCSVPDCCQNTEQTSSSLRSLTYQTFFLLATKGKDFEFYQHRIYCSHRFSTHHSMRDILSSFELQQLVLSMKCLRGRCHNKSLSHKIIQLFPPSTPFGIFATRLLEELR